MDSAQKICLETQDRGSLKSRNLYRRKLSPALRSAQVVLPCSLQRLDFKTNLNPLKQWSALCWTISFSVRDFYCLKENAWIHNFSPGLFFQRFSTNRRENSSSFYEIWFMKLQLCGQDWILFSLSKHYISTFKTIDQNCIQDLPKISVRLKYAHSVTAPYVATE